MKTTKSKMVIKGDTKYISYLSKHLQKEHPATKGKIKVIKK